VTVTVVQRMMMETEYPTVRIRIMKEPVPVKENLRATNGVSSNTGREE